MRTPESVGENNPWQHYYQFAVPRESEIPDRYVQAWQRSTEHLLVQLDSKFQHFQFSKDGLLVTSRVRWDGQPTETMVGEFKRPEDYYNIIRRHFDALGAEDLPHFGHVNVQARGRSLIGHLVYQAASRLLAGLLSEPDSLRFDRQNLIQVQGQFIALADGIHKWVRNEAMLEEVFRVYGQ